MKNQIINSKGLFYLEKHTSEDWNYYSKSWHRQYGPRKTVLGYTVCFSRPNINWDGVIRERKTSPFLLESNAHLWQFELAEIETKDYIKPNEFITTVAKIMGLTTSNDKAPKGVLLNDFQKIVSKRKINIGTIYRIYCPFYEKNVFCVQKGALNFHACTLKEAIAGFLRKDSLKAFKNSDTVLSFSKALKFGFCKQGIENFCNFFGLDKKGLYEIDFLKSLELEKFGEKFGFYEIKKAGLYV